MKLHQAIVAGVVVAALLPLSAMASSIDVQLYLNGALVVSESKNGQSLGLSVSRTVNNSGGSLQGFVLSTGEVRSKVNVFGTQPANGTVTTTATPVLTLRPPAGASFGGGRLVLSVKADTELTAGATIDLAMQVEAFTPSWTASGSNSQQVANQPGPDPVAFEVKVDLPATLDAARPIRVEPNFVVKGVASIAGGAAQSAEANVKSATIASFAVLDASGTQVTGFTLTGTSGVAVPEAVPPVPTRARAIEYYNAAFGHYFVTAAADEIAKLDAGIIAGWQRTGEGFNVYTTAGDRAAVCRFFSTAYGAKSSHFYAPRGLGCEAVFADPAWQFEGDVFYTFLPDATDGACPAGNIPVYRIYNDGEGGAPNHRFTTSEAVRAQMVAEGWIAEGRGIGVGWCSPQ